MTEQSLRKKTIKGSFWSAAENIAQYGVSFVVSIVLARLLTPDDYGLIGIIGIFTAICNAIINGGFTNALIRKIKPTDDDYNTAFFVNFGLSLLLYFVIFFISPFIADFFKREELIMLTRVASLVMIVGALGIVQQTRLTKEIDFKTQTKVTVIASLSSGLIGILLAFLDFGVWALVAQNLSAQFLRTIFLWHFNHWAPTLKFNQRSFQELFGFGWKMMASSVLDSLWAQLYQVVVGKFYSPATLGQYTRANQFSQLFSVNLTTVIQRVTYPVLSNIQTDCNRMITGYRKIIKLTMFITFSAMFGLGAVSEPLLYCLIGSKWHEAALYLPLICFVGAFYPLHAINLNMLQVLGRSDLFLGLEILKKILGIVPLSIGAFIGIFPMLYASIVISLISFFLNSYYSGKFLGYTSWMQIKDILPSFFVAGIMAAIVYILKYLPFCYWQILIVQIILGIFLILFLSTFLKLEEYKEVKGIVLSFLKKD